MSATSPTQLSYDVFVSDGPAGAGDERMPDGAPLAWSPLSTTLDGTQCEALFASELQRSDAPTASEERSLVTVAALTTGGNTDQLVYHLGLARQNGASETELIEAITHLAFYAGWPKAMSAMAVAKRVFRGE